jgi:hypothetical protein
MEKNNIIGIFDDPDVLLDAIHKVQDKGVKIKHVFSPFPIHGVWDALKMNTRLPYLTFIYGAFAVVTVFAFLYWTSVVNYPLKFGGKPLNTLSFIIIMFVGTIFIATFLTFMTFFMRQKIGPGKKVEMLDARTLDDKFAIVIERTEEMTAEEVAQIGRFLRDAGASEVNVKAQPEKYIEEETD